MIRAKGIIQVHNGYADTDELLDSVDELPDGEFGYLLFDKQKNRSLPQLKFLFGYLLKTLSEEFRGIPVQKPYTAILRRFMLRFIVVRFQERKKNLNTSTSKMNQQLRWISSFRRLSIMPCRSGISTSYQETD